MSSNGSGSSRREELSTLGQQARQQLDAAHAARELALSACRRAIRASGRSVRAVHALDRPAALGFAEEAAASLRQAQEALTPFPALAGSGPLHDAEKEYAEARLTAALVDQARLPSSAELAVDVGPWLCGLAEAASELRRHILDRLRAGEAERAEALLEAMDDAYGLVVGMDYPDAVTGGLRRTTDALRAVLERTRGDLTTTLLQRRLQESIERRMPGASSGLADL